MAAGELRNFNETTVAVSASDGKTLPYPEWYLRFLQMLP